jgi:hypothetical protein
MIENHQRDALLLELGAQPLRRAAAQVERRIRPRTPDNLAQCRCQPGGTCEGIEFIKAVCVQALAVDRNRKQCNMGRDDIADGFVAGSVRFQLSGLS